MIAKIGLMGVLFLFWSSAALAAEDEADDPLKLIFEEFLPPSGETQFDQTLVWRAQSNDEVDALFEPFALGSGEIVVLPIDVGTTNKETDRWVSVTSIRHGLTDRFEINGQAVLALQDERAVDLAGETDRRVESGLNAISAGLSYEVSRDDRTPALIVFGNVSLLEAPELGSSADVALGSVVLGARTYRINDPLLLSLSGGMRLARDRDVNENKVDPGELIFLEPNVSFLANDEFTLSGGFNISHSWADRLDGSRQGTRLTRAELDFGVAYAFSERMTLRGAARAETVASSGFTSELSVSYRF